MMIRKKIYKLLAGVSPLIQPLFSRRLRVLAYHKVPDKDAFEVQLNYLFCNYNIIGIEQLKAHLFQGQKLPLNPLLITFDDGDFSVFENGLPALQKFKLPCCLFIITSLINTSEGVWIKRVETNEMQRGRSYREAREVVNKMKRISNAERKEKMKQYSSINVRQLSVEELRELSSNNFFIGNHTHTHPMLNTCNQNEIEFEIKEAKKVMEALDYNGYDIFAYPNGNVDYRSCEVIRKEGIKIAFLFDHKINSKNLDPYNLSRIKVDADTEINEFKSKVSGIHPFLFKIKSVLR